MSYEPTVYHQYDYRHIALDTVRFGFYCAGDTVLGASAYCHTSIDSSNDTVYLPYFAFLRRAATDYERVLP